MTKLEAVKRLQELKNEAMKPWTEIHGMVLNIDGSHNRIYGLGIKHHTFELVKAISELIKSYEKSISDEEKTKFLELGGEDVV